MKILLVLSNGDWRRSIGDFQRYVFRKSIKFGFEMNDAFIDLGLFRVVLLYLRCFYDFKSCGIGEDAVFQ